MKMKNFEWKSFGEAFWEVSKSSGWVGILGWILFFAFTQNRVESRIMTLPQFMGKASLSQVYLPPWLSSKAKYEISNIVLKENFLSPHVVPLLYAQILSLPWIDEVKKIKREFPARIGLSFSVRKPVSQIQIHKLAYYIDSNGVPISPTYYTSLSLPQIQGIHTLDERKKLKLGAQMALLLKEFSSFGLFRKAIIDLSYVHPEKNSWNPGIRIISENGCIIEWGNFWKDREGP
ncbi:MAG: hypothetical protein D6785_01675, partial [Planctomycetota bacterium]